MSTETHGTAHFQPHSFALPLELLRVRPCGAAAFRKGNPELPSKLSPKPAVGCSQGRNPPSAGSESETQHRPGPRHAAGALGSAWGWGRATRAAASHGPSSPHARLLPAQRGGRGNLTRFPRQNAFPGGAARRNDLIFLTVLPRWTLQPRKETSPERGGEEEDGTFLSLPRAALRSLGRTKCGAAKPRRFEVNF